MQFQIQGQHFDVGDALREYVADKLETLNEKYFNHGIEASTTFSREGGHLVRAHISFQVGKGILIQADAQAGDAHSAFDQACERVAKQLRRYKRKLRDHHERLDDSPEAHQLEARDYVLKNAYDESEDASDHNDEPIVVAEMATNIQTMSVSEAVMRLDLADAPMIIFRNATNDALNVVYKREDGNVGWVDTNWADRQKKSSEGSAQTSSAAAKSA